MHFLRPCLQFVVCNDLTKWNLCNIGYLEKAGLKTLFAGQDSQYRTCSIRRFKINSDTWNECLYEESVNIQYASSF